MLNRECLACDTPLMDLSAGLDATIRTKGSAQTEDPDVRRIAHYRLIGLLGAGGMGEVYRAYDERLDRLVALKIVRTDEIARLLPEEQREETRRFIDEAQLTGRLDHPNICPIYELGEDKDGTVYFVMKMIQGLTLDRVWQQAGDERLAPELLAELLDIFIKVCEALSFAHSRGVIHRDIKPVNIMVGDFGQVYVMDWGAALLMELRKVANAPKTRLEVFREKSMHGAIVGTLRYMSPEQARGDREHVDERSDVFSLGATLYHMLAGRPIYVANDVHVLLKQAQEAVITPPHLAVSTGGMIPPTLSEIAMKAMAKNPDDRYESVVELQRQIVGFLRGYLQQPNRRYAPGSQIITQGEEGDAAYIIVKGKCVVVDNSGTQKVILRNLGPGDVFGEAAVFSEGLRTATVEALDEVTVTVVPRNTLVSALGLNSWLGGFVKALASRFSQLDEDLRKTRQGPLER